MEWSQGRGSRKPPPQRRCRSIILAHRRKAEDQFYCPQNRCSGIGLMVYKMMFYQASHYIDGTAVCIYMVRAVLRIVFHDKDYGLLPDRALAEVFDKFANGEVIIRHMGKRRQRPLFQTCRMIVSETHRIKMGHSIDSQQGIKFPFPNAHPCRIHEAQIPAHVIGTSMPIQHCNTGLLLVGKLTVGPETDACPVAIIPNEPALI